MAEHIPTAAHVWCMTEEQILLFCDVLAMLDDVMYSMMFHGENRPHDGFPHLRYSPNAPLSIFRDRYDLNFGDARWHTTLAILDRDFRFCGPFERGVACIVDDNVGSHESTPYIVTSFLAKLHRRILASLGARSTVTANALLHIATDIVSGELTAADFQEVA